MDTAWCGVNMSLFWVYPSCQSVQSAVVMSTRCFWSIVDSSFVIESYLFCVFYQEIVINIRLKQQRMIMAIIAIIMQIIIIVTV
jgi:ABC-type multidrug transport system permease subunit